MRSESTVNHSSVTPRSEPDLEQTTALLRSCYNCSSKKTRCDKKEPCSSCARAGKPCAYPQPGPRKRRTEKSIIADMASRIASLERSLEKLKREEKIRSVMPVTPVSENMLQSDTLSERSREDILVQEGSSSQYFNEILMSRAIQEVSTPKSNTASPYRAHSTPIESVLTPTQTWPLCQPSTSPFDASGILSAASLSIAPASLHPQKQLAVRLWNIFVERVEACSGSKILHHPTDEIKVYSTIDEPTKASPEDLALAFAVYYSAAVTLEAPEDQSTLGMDKHTFLLQVKLGLEQAFAHGDFLDRPTLTGLHALAIYLVRLISLIFSILK
jgi:hypothetical protein